MGDNGDVESEFRNSRDRAGSPEVEAAQQVRAVDRHRSHPIHVAVAVHMLQVRPGPRSFRLFPGDAREIERIETPDCSIRPHRRDPREGSIAGAARPLPTTRRPGRVLPVSRRPQASRFWVPGRSEWRRIGRWRRTRSRETGTRGSRCTPGRRRPGPIGIPGAGIPHRPRRRARPRRTRRRFPLPSRCSESAVLSPGPCGWQRSTTPRETGKARGCRPQRDVRVSLARTPRISRRPGCRARGASPLRRSPAAESHR